MTGEITTRLDISGEFSDKIEGNNKNAIKITSGILLLGNDLISLIRPNIKGIIKPKKIGGEKENPSSWA